MTYHCAVFAWLTIVAVETQQCIVFVVEIHVTVNNIKIEFCAKMPLWRIYVASNNRTTLVLT
jgi:hypothetical protein